MERSYRLLVFGCQMNLHDAERISGALEEAGWREAPSEEDADAVILLTCCVRESAEQRLYGRLSALKRLKDGGRVTIAVGGCLAQQEGAELLARAPYVDLVFGTHRYPEIASLLEAAARGAACAIGMGGLRLDGLPVRRRQPFRAWITITQGCDNYCSYCVVPLVRGHEESRPLEEVLREAAAYVSQGVREINLLGQNVNSYRRKEDGRSAFAALLRRMDEECGDAWVRFTTSHPRDFDDEIARAVAQTPNVCEYVHLPLQAGSDRILSAMNRGYSSGEYLEKAAMLRKTVEGVSLSTDVIVGFPGEREEDFRATLEVVESCRFDAAFTFVYNPRRGTAAALMPDDVPAEVKRERMERLTALTRRLTAASLREEVGREHVVLVYGPSRKDPGKWSARTRNNKLVHFPRGDDDIAGRFARVVVTSSGSWSLRGELLEVLG